MSDLYQKSHEGKVPSHAGNQNEMKQNLHQLFLCEVFLGLSSISVIYCYTAVLTFMIIEKDGKYENMMGGG